MQGNAWQQITTSGSPPSERDSHAAAWSDAADGLYIFGGTTWSTRHNDLWLLSRQAGSEVGNRPDVLGMEHAEGWT